MMFRCYRRTLLKHKAWVVLLLASARNRLDATLLVLLRLLVLVSLRCSWLFSFLHKSLNRHSFGKNFCATWDPCFDICLSSAPKGSHFLTFSLSLLLFLLRGNQLCLQRKIEIFRGCNFELWLYLRLEFVKLLLHLVIGLVRFAWTHSRTSIINWDSDHSLVKLCGNMSNRALCRQLSLLTLS